jgi:hypothetical protein
LNVKQQIKKHLDKITGDSQPSNSKMSMKIFFPKSGKKGVKQLEDAKISEGKFGETAHKIKIDRARNRLNRTDVKLELPYSPPKEAVIREQAIREHKVELRPRSSESRGARGTGQKRLGKVEDILMEKGAIAEWRKQVIRNQMYARKNPQITQYAMNLHREGNVHERLLLELRRLYNLKEVKRSGKQEKAKKLSGETEGRLARE